MVFLGTLKISFLSLPTIEQGTMSVPGSSGDIRGFLPQDVSVKEGLAEISVGARLEPSVDMY
jgi:hypothetical protein